MTISEYIADDLIARTRGGSPPEDLTLQGLADQYDVSLTPVRQAVDRLLEERFLLKQGNGRLEINRRKLGRGKVPKPSPPERVEDVHQRVVDWVVRQSFGDEAIYLREAAAVKALGVGRSVVREVFGRLAGSGVLEHRPRRGWRLRPFQREEMDHFLQAREAMELLALELARPHLEETELRRMLEGNCLPKSKNALPRIDNSLHSYFVETSGNPFIQDFFVRHRSYFDVLFDWESRDREAAIEEVQQHRRILEACLRRDWNEARVALSNHIRTNHPVLEGLAQPAELLPR